MGDIQLPPGVDLAAVPVGKKHDSELRSCTASPKFAVSQEVYHWLLFKDLVTFDSLVQPSFLF